MKIVSRTVGVFAAVCAIIFVFMTLGFKSAATEEEPSFASETYTATFIVDGEVYLNALLSKGEALKEPPHPEKEGYKFAGWFSDTSLNIPFEFGDSVFSDVILYGVYELSEPIFMISSIDATYDGETRKLAFDHVYHPLSDLGSFSYDWQKVGDGFSSSLPYLEIRDVSDSGIYFCKLTFSYNGDFVTVTTPEIRVNIKKCEIDTPVISSKEYTSYPLYADVFGNGVFEVRQTGGIDVGEYAVELEIIDKDNYVFRESGSGQITVQFVITKAQNVFTRDPRILSAYEGGDIRAQGSGRFGNVEFYYSEDGISFSTESPTAPGNYYFKAVIQGSRNYDEIESQVFAFKVQELSAVGIKIENAPTLLEYKAFDTVDLSGAVISASYNSGFVKEIPLSEITVSYKNGKHLIATDTSVLLTFEGCSVPLAVKVRRADYDLTSLKFEDLTLTYDGASHTISPVGEIVGLDGIPLYFSVSGEGTDAGTYMITLSFVSKSQNYNKPDSVEKILNIEPMPVYAEYSDTEFVYDGSLRLPLGYITLADGSRARLAMSGGGVDAGTYTATAIPPSGNYIVLNPEVSLTVKRAVISLDDFEWSASRFVYSGVYSEVYLSKLPYGVRAIGYVDSRGRDAGRYRAVARLSYDEKNYEPIPEIYLDWVIERGEYDMSQCTFADTKAVYSGGVHYPDLIGGLPHGADGSSPLYSFSTGAVNVSDGIVSVRIDFTSESKNYNPPKSLYASVEIVPLGIEVEWQGEEFIYDGLAHLPNAIFDGCGIAVTGYAEHSGEYVAYATSQDMNYKITNPSFTFRILRAENEWCVPPSITGIYESGMLSPVASSKFGEVMIHYFKDEALSEAVDHPSGCGVYFMVAEVSSTNDYSGLVSDPIRFEIIAVKPREIKAEILTELVAMQTILDKNIKITLINNDGSVAELCVSDVVITYQNSDSLRHGDSFVTVSYGDVSVSVSVYVCLAEYDMSGVKWENASHVYDSEEKEAYLVGLPDGVFVREYSANRGTNAGEYVLSAILDYDRDNYYPPSAPEGIMVIEKCVVFLPSPGCVTYNGEVHEASLPESPYYTASSVTGRDSGKYEIKVTLTDPGNYVLSSDTVYFEIKPIELTLKVLADGKSYSVEKGELLKNERPSIEFYTEGDSIYLRTSDKNYSLTVIPLVGGAAANRIWIGIIVFLLVALLSLGVIIAVKYPSSVRSITSLFVPKKRSVSAEAPALKTILATDLHHADSLISDTTASSLLTKERRGIKTAGSKRYSVATDSLSAVFSDGDTVDINILKSKELLPEDTVYVRIVGKGILDKKLTVIADSFDHGAVKMIAMTGGKAIKSRTRRKR